MPELAQLADDVAAACLADQRDDAEELVFRLELRIAKLGHMPPDVFDVLLGLLIKLVPQASSTYVLLVNLHRHVWSKHTPHQRQEVLKVLAPHAEALDSFEALQAIIELTTGQYTR
jgi:hypothetical protein